MNQINQRISEIIRLLGPYRKALYAVSTGFKFLFGRIQHLFRGPLLPFPQSVHFGWD